MTQPLRTGFEPAQSGWWPGPLDGERTRRQRRADVVVIGGGISGLVAADRLAPAGASVVVLEARSERVGGRLETARLDGTPVDLGGCFVGAAHDRLRALIGELGLRTFPAHGQGERVACRRGRIARSALGRRVTPRAVAHAVDRFEDLAGPGDDSASLASWLGGSSRWRPARRVLGDMLVNVLAASPDEVSLRHALRYVRSGGGLPALVGTGSGSQQDLVAGGAHAIATRLAARLGDAVELGAPVRRLECGATGVSAIGDGVRVDADSAVLALSPALAARIAVAPSPPPAPAVRPGDAIKYVALYPDAFWRRDGLSGMAWGDALPFSFTHDVSDPKGEPGLLAVFAVADRARGLRRLPPAARRDAILAPLKRCFGPRAATPLALAGRDWSAEHWSLGGYGTATVPGRRGAAPAASSGTRIVLAGTESAAAHHGYIEGAVRAAERAAAAVLAAN